MSSKPKSRASRGENPILVAEYDGRKAAIKRSASYNDTISSVKLAFKTLRPLSASAIEIWALLEEYDDIICITQEVWADLLPRLTEVLVLLEQSEQKAVSGKQAKSPKEKLTIKIHFLDSGMDHSVNISPNASVDRLKRLVCERFDFCVDDYHVFLDGNRLSGAQKLGECDYFDDSEFGFVRTQKGGKPVIYLFPPAPTADIRLNLALVKSWDFSALYPATPIAASTCGVLGQAVSWTVDAKPDGTLFDHQTQREVAYLFWEAHTNPVSPPSPPCSRPGSPVQESALAFDPARAELIPGNSVLLPFNKVTAYIDDALQSLGLHTEARTSFITYWLPELQAHEHLALRFLPQCEYEASAPMSITPTPDVTTRVFMLFKGVEADNLEAWASAQGKATEHPSMWRDIVGVSVKKALDTSLFRVLEWGGMEIKQSD
ncbi:hypothetical protein FRC12_004070 [Ceratobasidium sp. 428]|nr:hypothetical protein FRC12_004070 [Ceratobasidium sp. 428]